MQRLNDITGKGLITLKLNPFTFWFRIQKGISEWAVHPNRLNWHLEVDKTYMKVKENPEYIPPSSFITNSSKYGPIEITLNTPYRAGMILQLFAFDLNNILQE